MVGDLPTQPKATVLVVDDEAAVRRVLVMRLQLAGYTVVCAEDGEQALELFHKESPDLVVLDVMLPKLDGFAVCRRLRAESCVPIIFLSAVDAISEKVAGLDLGADDYLPKPFSPKELGARIATILRRVGRGNAEVESRELPTGQGVLRLGELVVDTNRRQRLRFEGFGCILRDPRHKFVRIYRSCDCAVFMLLRCFVFFIVGRGGRRNRLASPHLGPFEPSEEDSTAGARSCARTRFKRAGRTQIMPEATDLAPLVQ